MFNASADALVLLELAVPSASTSTRPTSACTATAATRCSAGLAARASCEDADTGSADGSSRARSPARRYHGEIETVRRSGERFPIEVRTIPIRHRGEPHVLAMIRDLTERTAGRAGARPARGAAAPGAEDGGDRPADGRHRARLQQPAHLRSWATSRSRASGSTRSATAALGRLPRAGARSCERARDLIQQMLMFSRGQRGAPRPLRSRRSCANRSSCCARRCPRPSQLVIDVRRRRAARALDPVQVEQVLLNLCINARDAIDGAGTTCASVCTLAPRRVRGMPPAVGGQFVEIAMHDTARDDAGTDRADVRAVFLHQGPRAGSGMGLAMVHGIVHEHGGHVLVESQPGRGSRFRVIWPALRATGDGTGRRNRARSNAATTATRRPRAGSR